MSIWADPSAIPSPPANSPPPPPPPIPAPLPPTSSATSVVAAAKKPANNAGQSRMSAHNFDAIESVPFDATTNDMEQILSSLASSSASSTKADDTLANGGGALMSPGMESKRMSSLLVKLGSYFSHANGKAPMSPTSVEMTHQRSPKVGSTMKRHATSHVNSSSLNHKLSSSKCSHSDNSSISANSTRSTQSTVPGAPELATKQLTAVNQLRNDSSETFTLPRVNLKQR